MHEYTYKEIIKIIKNAPSIEERKDTLDPDHELLLSLYDVEVASKYLKRERKQLFSLLLEGKSMNEVANLWDTYEMDIRRKRKRMALCLDFILNTDKKREPTTKEYKEWKSKRLKK